VDLLGRPGQDRATALIDRAERELSAARPRVPTVAQRSRRALVLAALAIALVRLVPSNDAVAASSAAQIMVSMSPDRSNAVPLDSSTVAGDLHVFVAGLPSNIREVRFYVDDPRRKSAPVNVERVAPYDLSGTNQDGTAQPLSTTGLADGSHNVSILARTPTSASIKLTATFTVANASSAAALTDGAERSTTTTTAPTTTTTAPTTTTTAPTTTTTTAPTTTTTAPTNPTTGTVRLRWSPPALSSPTTITVGPSGGSFKLDTSKDYIVRIPQKVSAVGGVTLNGGRNVVLIGGHITIPWAGSGASGSARRALYLKGQTGVAHIEGLLIDNSGGDLSEGIQIAAPAATVQIQNVRITGAHARDQSGFTDNHPDLIQPWGGAARLRIDRFSGSTDYQAFMLKADSNGPLGPVHVSNVNVWPTEPNLSRYLLWQGPDSVTYPLSYENVWLTPASGRSLGKAAWPDISSSNTTKRAILSADGTSLSWPTASQISGVVRSGAPPGGDFVPAGLAGVGYTSPGYL
jgi:hypothetical protein